MLLLVLLLALGPASSLRTHTVTPEEFGAVGDGKADDSLPIQQAVSSCAVQRGRSCNVVFAQRYLSGPISVNSSYVTFVVKGTIAILPKHRYAGNHSFITNGDGDPSRCRHVAGGYRVCLKDFRITGGGEITSTDPLGWWWCKYAPFISCWRPHMVALQDIEGVVIDDITLRDSPNHHIEVDNCVGVNFYGGFDQSISDSVISNGDDCISVVPIGLGSEECANTPRHLNCSGGHVVARNVSCHGGHGISVGGIRHGSVRNVTFSNLTATAGPTQGEAATGGVRVKSYPNSSGLVSEILYEDIVLAGVYLPLQLVGEYCPFPCKTKGGNRSTHFENIIFRNIRGTGKQRSLVGDLDCSPWAPCRNISLVGVELAPKDGGKGELRCKNTLGVNFADSTPGACGEGH